jgi:DNA-binding response OmpR family regulator
MNPAKTILVVDDDHDLRAGLQAVLQRRGYRTLGADDGMQAKQLIDGQRPDLVILDMMMPRWGGFAVLEHYQGQAAAPPFMMITASDGDQHRQYAEEIGVAAFLRKPFSMDRFLAQVDEVLRPSDSDSSEASSETSSEDGFIRCRCLSCDARIKAPLRLAGQSRPCPRCKEPVTVRREPPQDEGPLLVIDDRQPVGKTRSGLWHS